MNLEKYNDKDLVELLNGSKKSKDSAFKEVYRRYSPVIVAYCRCLIYEKEVAEDIFQETFIKFYNSLQNEKDLNNIPGFLTTIARNLCYNHTKLKKRNVDLNENLLFIDANKTYDNKELMELIITSLELIEPLYREAFIMKEFEGLSYNEIAERLDISTGNAKTRALRAKQKIIGILSPYLRDLSKNN